MKFPSCVAVATLVSLTTAFPIEIMEALRRDPLMLARIKNLTIDKRGSGADAATDIFEANPTFDVVRQYVDVSEGSGHEWQAPGPNDLRGECPGLNAFANHGFLPRSGIASIAEFAAATQQVTGMGFVLSTFLSVYGALIASGDLQHWSIGGPVPPGVDSLLGQQGTGIIGAHNKYELDASPMRGDLYETGNNYLLQLDYFQQLIDASPGGFVTLDSITTFRAQRWDASVANNPYFFNGPFPGLLLNPATYTFIWRLMANHSAEQPAGVLSYDVLKSWFAVEGESGSYTTKFGYERIPDNWWRRSMDAPYELDYYFGDLFAAASEHPQFLDIGGNMGKGGDFVGINLANFTGGLFNGPDLLKGNNLGCLLFQLPYFVKSDFVFQDVLNSLQDVVGDAIGQLACPQLEKVDTSLLEQFPGYQKAPVF